MSFFTRSQRIRFRLSRPFRVLTIVLIILLIELCNAHHARAASAGVLAGKVIDQATGEPLRKVRVVVQESPFQTVTGDDGAFRLEGIPSGTYVVSVSTIGYRLLKKEIRVVAGEMLAMEFYLGQEAATISDLVLVTAPVFEEVEKAAPSQLTLNSTEIKNLAGVLIDDPLRSVQTLPGVATGDDFHSLYSVRGGGFHNNGLIVDGVLTHNLAHSVQGTQEPTGSITIMNGDLVESMALYSGGFSAKYGDRTASFLEVVTREGSRDRTRARIAVSGSNAAIVAEGPIDATRRGSWIVSARKSYADYLVRRIGPDTDLNLGFGDVQGKLSHDVSDRHRLGASFTWGRAVLSRNPQNRGVTSLIDGSNNVGVANFSWSFLPSPTLLWENRLYLIRETFLNRNRDGEVLDRGEYTELAVRSDLSIQAGFAHRLELGGMARFIENKLLDRRYDFAAGRFLEFDSARAGHGQQAVYAQDRWNIRQGKLQAILGARVERTELTGQTIVTPRASIEWRLGERDLVEAGWGVFSQFPEALPVLGRNGAPRLRAEVSRHYLLGYEHRIGSDTRLRVEVYDKEESNLWRSRDNLFRLVQGRVTPPDTRFRYDNALRGHSRGFEIFLQRRSANRLAGWLSYGFQSSRRRDLATGEVYSNDFEQRHTVNLYGSYRLTERWNLSLKARLGSGFPYPGYFEKRGDNFFLSEERNQERVPYYSRIDLRLNRAFYFVRTKLSLYLEILNVLNRENIRYEQTFGVNASTRRISFARATLLPILPTLGFVLEF